MGTNPPRPTDRPADRPAPGPISRPDPGTATPPAATRTPVGTAGRRWRGRLRARLDAIRAHPPGRMALKVVIGLVGAVVVAVGIVLIPLPGPGWALVILGLAIWAVEFAWARDMLHFTRSNVQKWTRWVSRQSLPIRMALGTVGLIFVSAVVWASLKFSFGIDVVDTMRNYLAAR